MPQYVESHKLTRFLAHACLQKKLQNKLVRISLSTTDAQRKTPELEKGDKFTRREKRAGKKTIQNRQTEGQGIEEA